MIKVNACIIHEVIKEAKSATNPGTATFDLSEALLSSDDEFVTQLLISIHRSFGDDSALRNTHFEKDTQTVFSTNLNKYVNPKSKVDFLSFSSNSIKAIKSYIEKENFAVGGYYVFGDYEIEGRRFISVMVVRKNKNAINFKKVGKVHKPARAENINTEKIAMGFRLNCNLYQPVAVPAEEDEAGLVQDRNYVALLAGQQDRQLSGYFKDWVNAAGIISNDKNSTAFIDIINNIDLPVDDQGRDKYTREEFKRLAYNYFEQSTSRMVDVNAFSEYAYGADQRDRVMKYAAAQSIVMDPEFTRATAIFKRLVTIRARVPGIELNVDYEKLNPNEVDVQSNKIVIKSPKLIEQINAQK